MKKDYASNLGCNYLREGWMKGINNIFPHPGPLQQVGEGTAHKASLSKMMEFM
jgi:hypothetical protein